MKDILLEKYYEFVSTSKKFVNKWVGSVNDTSPGDYLVSLNL